MVLLSHIAVKSSQYQTGSMDWYHIRGTGVDLFFIMSGFMMCYISSIKEQTPARFLLTRTQRLLPLYWFFTFLALFVYLYNPSLVNSSGGYTDIVASFLILPTEYKYLVQNGWTLRYELYFSLIFALFLMIKLKNSIKLILMAVVFSIISMIGLVFDFQYYLVKYFFNIYMIEFALGILAFFLFNKLNKLFSVLLVVLGFSMLIYQNAHGDFISYFDRLYSKAFPMYLIFLGSVNLEDYFKLVKNLFFSKLLNKLSDASYSLFLSHPFTLTIAAKFCKKLDLLHPFIFFIVLMFTAITVALLVHRYIEMPINKFVKNRLSKKA